MFISLIFVQLKDTQLNAFSWMLQPMDRIVVNSGFEPFFFEENLVLADWNAIRKRP